MEPDQNLSFIAYLDDDGNTKEVYGTLIETKDGLVTFRTKETIITIPTHRLLKIKRRVPEEAP